MSTLWVPGAQRLTPHGASGTMAGGAAKVIVHTTEGGTFDSNADYLAAVEAEPHLLYDPNTDRLGQFYPLDSSARALKAGGGTSKNKDGRVVIQVEVVGYASRPFTDTWHPGPNWAAVLAAAASWGVADRWPAGGLSTHGEAVSRSVAAWDQGGWYGHANVPDNDHWDPGGISQSALLAAGEEDTMGDVSIVGITEASAQVIAKAIWERYKPGGDNMATIVDKTQNDVAAIRDQLADLTAAIEAITS